MKIIPYLYIPFIVILIIGIGYNFVRKQVVFVPAVPVVIEMFTSAYCPSCPPADRILAETAKSSNVFALSCHVPYMDSPDQKDPFGQDFCAVRQHGYADSLGGDKKIFTPQMVINGTQSALGYQKEDISSALAQTASTPPAPIELRTDENHIIHVTLPQREETSYLRLWAFGYAKPEQTDKNRPNTNPVTSQYNLGSWDGNAKTLQLDASYEEAAGIIVVAQENGYGRIVAVGHVDIK